MKTLFNRALLVASSFFIIGCSIDKQIKKFAEEGGNYVKEFINENYYKNIRKMYEVKSETYKFDYIYSDKEVKEYTVGADTYYYDLHCNIVFMVASAESSMPLHLTFANVRASKVVKQADSDGTLYASIKALYDNGTITGETGSFTL